MKKYEKPKLEVIQLKIEENLANNPGNTTKYDMYSGLSEMETLALFGENS
ncbi:MAG: hypothetical protein LBH54_05435 [Clostridiales bacterium]|jgi:hypothetical protein|nr:hypothetical protein [Clostridiales bacterium]